ncbi:META domain-containing protein [Salinibacterium sp. TMP30]|uniref:META domain-containing protein n=1 Tax=Salinibacterium sp. TMP30 TaxID=3138237 RepID=UPI0031398622
MPTDTIPTDATPTPTMFKKIAPLFAISLLALTACAGPALTPGSDEPPLDSGPGLGEEETPGDPIPIEGIDGSWTYADGTDSSGELSTDVTVTLMISGSSIVGASACNNYAATLAGEPSALRVGAVSSTKRACDNALMDFDTRYFSALGLVTAAIPTGGSLVMQGDGVNLNFMPASSPPLG